MLLGRVIGTVWGAKHAPTLEGFRLLVISPLTAAPASPKAGDNSIATELKARADAVEMASAASNIVAVDCLGAGPGELVLVAHGSRCRDLTVGEWVAEKDVVVAIVDEALVARPPDNRAVQPGSAARVSAGEGKK